MASKPQTLPRWANTVTADPTQVVEPPSAKKDLGFQVFEQPPIEYLNWLWNLIYQWFAYLDDEAEVAADIEGENFVWTGTHTFQQDVQIDGTLILASTWTASGITTFNGTVQHNAAVTLGAGSDITGGGGDIVQSGFLKTDEPDIRHATTQRTINAAGAVQWAFTTAWNIQSGCIVQGTNIAVADSSMPLAIPTVDGDRILKVAVHLRDDTGFPLAIRVRRAQRVGTAISTTILTNLTPGTDISLGNNTIQQLHVTLSEVVAGPFMYWAEIYSPTNNVRTNHQIYSFIIDTDRL